MSERTVPISMGSDARTLDELGLIAPLTSAEYAAVREQCGTSEHELLAAAIHALKEFLEHDDANTWQRAKDVIAIYDATHPTAGV